MKILLADMEQICKPCAEKMKQKNLISVRIEEEHIDRLLALGDIGVGEARNLRTAVKVEKAVGKKVIAVEGFRGKSMFGVKDIKGELCPECKKDLLENDKCAKCGYGKAESKTAIIIAPVIPKIGHKVESQTDDLIKPKTEFLPEPEEEVLTDEDIDRIIKELEVKRQENQLSEEEAKFLKKLRKEKVRYEDYSETKPGEEAEPIDSKLPKTYERTLEEPKDLTKDIDIVSLFKKVDTLTEEITRIDELVTAMEEKAKAEEGYEEKVEGLEEAWKQIRKKVGDQPGRVATIKDNVYYIMNQIRRSFKPSYKDISEQIVKEFEIEFKDIEGRMRKRYENLRKNARGLKDIFKLYTSPLTIWKKFKKGQLDDVVDLPAGPPKRGEGESVDVEPEVAPTPVTRKPVTPEVVEAPTEEIEDDNVTSKMDLLDEAIGHSYDILDTVTGIDDDLTVLEFTISDLMDRLDEQETNGVEE